MKYIFDTSAIIVLLEICGLQKQLMEFSLLNELYAPTKVKEEYCKGSPIIGAAVFRRLFRDANSNLAQELLPYFNFDASSGEIWVISHACRHQDCCCVVDEGFGRSICELFKVKVTGAIGIIKAMKKQGLLSAQDVVLIKHKIKHSRFYSSKELLDELEK